MSDAMPAFGANRNLKIAELLGWTGLYLAQSPRTPGGAWGNDPADAPGLGGQRVACNFLRSAVPNYCGDDAACFGLLVTLLDHIEIKDLAMGRYGQRVLVTVVLNRPKQVNGLSDFPETNAGWRDAITQAAWVALTAAKESK